MLFHNISMPLIAEESGAATSQTILDGSDTVCRTQDYKFYVNVPEGATVTWGYEFVYKGYSPIDLIFENGKYYGLLNSQNYPEEETSFKVYVTVQTSTGSYRVKKIVTFIDHEGGTPTCSQKAICIHCGQEYGEIDPSNHTLIHVPAKEVTASEKGNIEYWRCEECDKNFADAQGSTELSTVVPVIVEGNKQSVKAGEKKALSFTSNADIEDFVCVKVDGKEISADNYSVKKGSIVVTLNADYVSKLSSGKHTIDIVATTGVASAEFTIEATKTSTNKQEVSTGLISNTGVWSSLCFGSADLMAIYCIFQKKRNRK